MVTGLLVGESQTISFTMSIDVDAGSATYAMDGTAVLAPEKGGRSEAPARRGRFRAVSYHDRLPR